MNPPSNGPDDSRDIPTHALESEAVLARVGSSAAGLSTGEAAERLREHGPNVLPRGKRDGALTLFWRQINNPLIWVLIASGIVAMGADWEGEGIKNGLVILAVVAINSIIGFVQEYRAARAIEALSQMVPENVTVLRDNSQQSISAAELVPGDVVLLTPGDRVPADLRILSGRNIQIEEAALTGESVAVGKNASPVAADAALGDRANMAFAGTVVTYGTGAGVVVTTAADTELGKISTLLHEATDLETPLTRALAEIGRTITIGILALTAVMLVIGVVRTLLETQTSLIDAFLETLIFAIALAVGAIPEGLPAIVTIALAIGVQRMARRHAIIRRLPAVETLGSTTIICSDKTGTLTRNEMTVRQLWTPSGQTFELSGVGYEPRGAVLQEGREVDPPDELRKLVQAAALCSDATLRSENGVWTITGDPTEGALVVAAEKLGDSAMQLRDDHPRIDCIPFESENQWMATLHRTPDGSHRVLIKGAPEAIARRCEAALTDRVQDEVHRLADQGMRVLAVAARTRRDSRPAATSPECLEPADAERGFHLLGLLGMIDPPREEAIRAIDVCRTAGITVKMITGDHHATAQAIGAQLGILTDNGALRGTDLAAMDPQELQSAADRVNVFARVAPEHKLRLVRALQQRGEVVAMTGDGVNDAPSLKQANIGVAMGITGTAASKQASDIVLADDNFATLGAAVQEGRRVYDNLIKSLAFVLPTNLGLALILLYAVAFFPFNRETNELLLALSPLQLLWINLVATVSLALPLAFEAPEPDVMLRPPRQPGTPILSRFLLIRTAGVAVLMTAAAVGVFLWEYYAELRAGVPSALARAESQTLAVTTIILFQCFYLANCRSLQHSFVAVGVFTNKVFYLGIAMVLILQAGFIYLPLAHRVFGSAPLNLDAWFKAIAVGAIIIPAIVLEKRLKLAWAATR